MHKTTAGLLGAVAALAIMGAAQAATSPALNPAEFMRVGPSADLQTPVQNATALMKADDAMQAERGRYEDDVDRTPENVRLADWNHDRSDQGRDHHHGQGFAVPGGTPVR